MIWTTRPRSEGAGALAYFTEGEGHAVVFIHGVGLQAEAWCGVVPDIAQHYRAVCIDMPGHGASPLEGAATLNDFVDRCARFVEALDGPVRLVGHSMGALIAVEVAARLPRKVVAAAALNTVYRRSPAAAQAVAARAAMLLGPEPPDPTPTLQRWFGANPQGEDAACAMVCHTWLTQGSMEGYAAAYRVFAHTDGPKDTSLQELSCSTLYLTGSVDPNSTAAMSHDLAAMSRLGHAAVLADAAHMMPMTHPQQVAQQITQFFSAPRAA